MSSRGKLGDNELEKDTSSSSDGRDVASNFSSPRHHPTSPSAAGYQHHDDADIDDDDSSIGANSQQEQQEKANNSLIIRRARKRRAQHLSQQHHHHQDQLTSHQHQPQRLRLMTDNTPSSDADVSILGNNQSHVNGEGGTPNGEPTPRNGVNGNGTRGSRRTRRHSSSSTGSSTRATSPEDERYNPLKGIVPPDMIICSWCQNVGSKKFTLQTTDAGGRSFCSELCFNQYRRASFKKSRLCDWCKGVRGTVNLVNYMDGDAKLQFCSDTCLNQYKMNIFCKETQAHLELLHNFPDLMKQHSAISNNNNNRHGLDGATTEGDNKITPDLWLVNGENENSQYSTDGAEKEQQSSTPSVKEEEDPPPRSRGLRQKNLKGNGTGWQQIPAVGSDENRPLASLLHPQHGRQHARQNDGQSASAVKAFRRGADHRQNKVRRASLSPSLSSPPALLPTSVTSSRMKQRDLERSSGMKCQPAENNRLQHTAPIIKHGPQQDQPQIAGGHPYHCQPDHALQQLYATAMLQASQALSASRVAGSTGCSLVPQAFFNFMPFINGQPPAISSEMNEEGNASRLMGDQKPVTFQPLNLTKVLAPTACKVSTVIPTASVTAGALAAAGTGSNTMMGSSSISGQAMRIPKVEPASPDGSSGADSEDSHGMASSVAEDNSFVGKPPSLDSNKDHARSSMDGQNPTQPGPATRNRDTRATDGVTLPADIGHGAAHQPLASSGNSSWLSNWLESCISSISQKFPPSITAIVPVPIVVPLPIPVPIFIPFKADTSSSGRSAGEDKKGGSDSHPDNSDEVVKGKMKSGTILDLSSQQRSE